jgi:G3E family GTPase
VIIETTGLADPAPIIHTLMTLPVTQRYRLDVVLTTVDGVNGEATLDKYPEAVKQAAVADRLLLTKTDLATRDTVESMRARLKSLNPAAPVALADGRLAPDKLFDTALYDPATKTVDVQNWLRAEAYAGRTTRAEERSQRHADGIDSFCTVIDEPLEWRLIAAWLDLLAGHRGERLLRVKGIFNVRDAEGPIVVNAVQHLFHPPVQLERWPDADRRSRVVFITRDLPRHIIEETLATLRQARGADASSLASN